ncbi:ABC transporter permease [Lactobacillus gallinarum]|uniref:Antibiotic transporter permease n=1 Tax=Lactobacillus gallinarum TaxID=52242 RepID=A0A1Y4UCE7_9LACO|nr:ABC transporter permease [Lactobacillus gallinarum]OUQ55481.1 antibiotic transporter permease [Lactobacillus gallinarum]OUQ75714.1 antibiotic transporter permease [Lactobacillus gallinarum]
MATQFSSLSFLANWKTRFVYFLILPIINLLLLVLIDLQYSNQFNWYVAASSIVIDSAALSIQTMSQLLITDANLGIDLEMIAKRPYSPYYWGTKFLTSLIAGIVLGVINVILLLLFGLPWGVFFRCLVILPVACVFGAVMGFTGWSLSWQMKNPYFFTNLFGSVITIVSGVLVVISNYPAWLRSLSYIFPFYELVNFVKLNNTNLWLGILIAAIWLVIGIVLYVTQIKSVLNKKIHQY